MSLAIPLPLLFGESTHFARIPVSGCGTGCSVLRLQEGFDGDMSDSFINFRGRAANPDGSNGLAVNLDGQTALVRKSIGEREHLQVAVFQLIGRGFGWLLVHGGVTRLLL